MKKNYAVVLAGGLGQRMGADVPKQFLYIDGRPVIARSIECFNSLDSIHGIVVVSAPDYIHPVKEIIAHYDFKKVLAVVPGGKTRQLSSYNAIKSGFFSPSDIILFHDAARPFVSAENIAGVIAEADIHGAAALYVRATDTVTSVENGFVDLILPREKLFYAQTPQAFRYDLISDAHEKAMAEGFDNATDDVGLLLRTGKKIKVVTGEYSNIKITTAYDYYISGKIINYLDDSKKNQ